MSHEAGCPIETRLGWSINLDNYGRYGRAGESDLNEKAARIQRAEPPRENPRRAPSPKDAAWRGSGPCGRLNYP